MTSLFEPDGGARKEMPVDLMTRGVRGVSLLEFMQVSEPVVLPEMPVREREESASQDGGARVRVMVDAARVEAKVDPRREFEGEMHERLAEERVRVERVCEEFSRDRARYFAAAEVQVVRLALAIARRVLTREVDGDRLHLAETVKAALARVQDDGGSVLHVPVADVESWREMFRGGLQVEVVGDAGLSEGECELDTKVGRVEMGVRVQMEEIERGFGELLQRQETA